jgi:hypothetical protein
MAFEIPVHIYLYLLICWHPGHVLVTNKYPETSPSQVLRYVLRGENAYTIPPPIGCDRRSLKFQLQERWKRSCWGWRSDRMMWTSSLISCILIVSLYMRDRQWGISLPGVNEFLRNFLALQTVGPQSKCRPNGLRLCKLLSPWRANQKLRLRSRFREAEALPQMSSPCLPRSLR